MSLPFNVSMPSFQEFGRILRKCWNSYAPGPNGIPYLIWKCCPFLSQLLYKLICRVWATGLISPAMWQKASIILVAKSEKLDDPSQFHPIALGNCDGKIFFFLLSRCLLEYLLSNNYLGPSIQKGFLSRVAGCVEHTTLSLSALEDAKKAGRNICTTWIDLKNAFGSIQHSSIRFALARYHLPLFFRWIVFDYYEKLMACIVTKSFQYSIGVFQGCTISPAIFNNTL